MKIKSVLGDFKPTNFQILDFYSEETCFVWVDDKIALFPYNTTNSTINVLPITAPKSIKSVHSYLKRVFIVCNPCGIYKLTKSHEFALLSVSGLATGAEYYEVLILKDNFLLLENKRDKETKELLILANSSANLQKDNQINFLHLTSNITHENLQRPLFIDEKSICLITNQRTLFKLSNKVLQIVYECLYNITEIIPVKKNDLILGCILKTNSKFAVFLHVKNNKLFFKKIYFHTEIISLTAEFLDNSEDVIYIVYSDKEKVYFAQQNVHLDFLHKISWKKEVVVCCKNFKNKIIVLTSSSEINELTYNMIKSERLSRDHEVFQEIKNGMLKGSELIVENICENARELDELNQKLNFEKDKLYRINIFTDKQRIPCIPKIKVDSSGQNAYLKVSFDSRLPQGSYITVNVSCNGQTTFSTKLVEDNETMMEIALKSEYLDSSIDINFDLVTFAEVNKPWCILKDCLKEPSAKEKQKLRDCLNLKTNFLNSKLSVLKNLVPQDGQIDEKKLSNIRKGLRRELPDI